MTKQTIIGLTISGLLVSIVAPWVIQPEGGASDTWMGLDGVTRGRIIALMVVFSLIAFGPWITARMGGLAAQSVGQEAAPFAKQILSPQLRDTGSTKSAQDLLDDLEGMVGLLPVKREINAIIARLTVEAERAR